MPANSRPDAFDVALIGLSARALARSARRAGLRALTLDLFADADTREDAAKAVKVAGRGAGLERRALLAALVEHSSEGLPIVFGAGFEGATSLMAAIGRRHRICGAAPDVVRRLKQPFEFAEMLGTLAIQHPEIARACSFLHLSPAGRGRRAAPGEGVSSYPEHPEAPSPARLRRATSPRRGEVKEGDVEIYGRWLSKRVGGSGGAHIRAADGRVDRRRYAQRHVSGAPFSALFLADGRCAHIVGFSMQWTDPTPKATFRYGGAVGPVDVAAPLRAAVAAALHRIVAATGLVGLASADMLAPVDGAAGFTLLEINPRPGATLDVFDRGDAPSLLAAHLAACDGRLPLAAPPEVSGVQAAALVYAPRRTSVAGLERPSWTADWPADGDMIPIGAPVCTVLAAAPSPAAARALVDRRRAALLASLPFVRRAADVSSSKAMATT